MFYIKFLIVMTIVRFDKMISFFVDSRFIHIYKIQGRQKPFRKKERTKESPSIKLWYGMVWYVTEVPSQKNHESFMKQQKGSAEMSQ